MITVFTLGHVAYLMVLPAGGNPQGGGPALVFFLVCLTQLNDVAQYVWGRTLGRLKVIPRVSPNKTLEGLAGGVLTTALAAALVAPYLTPMGRGRAAVVGLLMGLAGFVGDVVISAVKRDLGIKDAGALIPGHGGILDRIDSHMYTAPLFFHFVRYVYY
jgi:phosphatidate cytidylyltransferase